jgi:hypothetical protein
MKPSMKSLLTTVSVAGLVACGGAPRQGGEMNAVRTGSDAMQTLTGRVYLTGTDPMVMVALQVEGQSSVNLVGDLSGELRRLAGATVEVQGTRRSTGMMDEFHASDYRVVHVDGQVPVVGIVVEQSGGYLIQTTDGPVTINGVPNALKKPGAKVWVTGRETETGLYVQSFGVIRDP